jgi:hypothetical protein
LDDIVELIDSTLYKVKELSESKVVDLKDFLTEALLVNESNLLTAASKKYWTKMLGFNPAEIDYKKTKAKDNFEKFANADKLSELFDYLVSGMSRKHEYTQSQWINIIADMDIDDYETYNGPLNGLRESAVNEAQSFLDGCESYPSNWDLIDIFDETDGGKPAKLKNVDWAYYFDDEDFVERNKQKIIKQFTDFFAACNSIQNVDCGNVGEGGFNDEMFREEIGIEPDECGVGLFKDGDDGTWTIITFTKEIDSLPKPQQTALLNMMSKYENSGWYYVEYFDAV